MFAKLKKKIEEQGGNVQDSDKFNSSGNATPRKSPGGAVLQGGYDSDSSIQSPTKSEEMGEFVGTKEEVMNLLLRRTEQCKKLESKISEYASIIKEKNRSIEKLEGSLEKQQETYDKKIHDQNEQYQKSRAKLSEGFTLALQKKDEEIKKVLEKLNLMEEDKSKQFKREEENDELQGLAAQELAKVKHMLLNTQEELRKVKNDIKEKASLIETQEKNLLEIPFLQEKLQELQQKCELLTEENKSHTKLVGSLSVEKKSLQSSIEKMTSLLKEKSTEVSSLEERKTELENEQQGLMRNFDLHKNKTTKLLEEKDDHIDKLQERIQTLEQRFQDQNLQGDERVTAVENERTVLEQKLEESRQQLTEIKSTWSDKISHLEQQISHLNQKIVEDSEELIQSQKMTDTVRENFTAQVQQLQVKLDDAERRAEEHWNLATKKDELYEKEKNDLESQLQKANFDKIDVENHLRAKVDSLESQILSLEEAKEHEKNNSSFRIAQMETQQQEYIDKLLNCERKIEELEEEKNKHMNDVMQTTAELQELRGSLESEKNNHKEISQKLQESEALVLSLKEEISNNKKLLKEKERDFTLCNQEKDELCLRNAELSQEILKVKRDFENQIQQLKHELREKDYELSELQKNLSETESRLQQNMSRIQEYENLKEQHSSRNTQISELEQQVTNLQDEVADKNKALKKQEQRLSDLKKTLQRELKVQALPSDDPVVIRSQSPLRDQKSVQPQSTQSVYLSEHERNGSTARSSAPNSPAYADLLQVSRETNHLSSVSPAVLQDVSSMQHVKNSQERVRSLQDSIAGHSNIMNSAANMNSLEKDINFQYLKHVVMKFMLSREPEAIQLIRAVSVLLKFSAEEQKLIRETLEWKMSWFGSKPPTGSGQRAKFIPPSY